MDKKEAAERIQEVMTIIKTQHMCEDIDGECTAEDRETYIQRFESLRMAIEALQEPERKKGRWIEGNTLEKCSICGKKGFPDWRYCPSCGADMRGEEE